MDSSPKFGSSSSPFEDSLEYSGTGPIVHTFINDAEVIPDDFIVSPSPPKIINQQPNIPIVSNPQTIEDDFSPLIESPSHNEYKPPVFSSSPSHYNYSYENEKPSSPVTYHDYKPNFEFYSIPPPPMSDNNSPEAQPKQQKEEEEHILSPDINQEKEKEKAKKEEEERMERKRLEYQRLQQKRQVIQQQQQIQLLKLKQQYQQNQQLQQQEPDYQKQLQLERQKYQLIQQKIQNMKQQNNSQQQQQHKQTPIQQQSHLQQYQQNQQQQIYQQQIYQQQYQQQPPPQHSQYQQIQQQRQPLLAKPQSPTRNVKNAFESIHISSSSPSNHIHSLIEERSPIISPHKPKINLPVFDIDLDFHTKAEENEKPNNRIMSPLFKEEEEEEAKAHKPQPKEVEVEEEEDLPLWAKVASKKNSENLKNQENINESNNSKPRRKQWNDEISNDIQKRREKYPPKQPDAPTLFALKPTCLLIKWNENKNDKRKKYYKIDSYMLQYQIYPDGIWKNVGNGIIRNLNYTYDNLKSGYNYRFRIKAHNSEGWSIYSNCSEIYTVPGEKKKEENNNNNKRKSEIKIGVRREFSSIRKSSIDEDLKRKEIAERRNIYLYNGKYPKYSDKIKTNKKRSVSEIKSRVKEESYYQPPPPSCQQQQQQQQNERQYYQPQQNIEIIKPKYSDEPVFVKENKVPKLNLLTESYQKLQEEEAKLKSDLNTIDEKWERHISKFSCRKPSSLPPPSVFGDDSSYLSYRSYYSEMPIPQNRPLRMNPSLPKRSRNTIGKSNK